MSAYINTFINTMASTEDRKYQQENRLTRTLLGNQCVVIDIVYCLT